LSASRPGNRSLRSLEIAPRFGNDGALGVAENQVLEVADRLARLELPQQEPCPLELRGRRGGARPPPPPPRPPPPRPPPPPRAPPPARRRSTRRPPARSAAGAPAPPPPAPPV